MLGPDFSGEVFAFRRDFEDLQGTGLSSTESQAGLRLTYNLGNHATLRTSATYVDFNYKNNALGDYTAWIGRAELFYRFARSFHGRLIYQYQAHDSDLAGDSYYENFIGINFIKYF